MWLNEIERHASENVCKVIVGNKSDLAAERAVDWTEGYVSWNGFCLEVFRNSPTIAPVVLLNLLKLQQKQQKMFMMYVLHNWAY